MYLCLRPVYFATEDGYPTRGVNPCNQGPKAVFVATESGKLRSQKLVEVNSEGGYSRVEVSSTLCRISMHLWVEGRLHRLRRR